jgi:uncharacterized protein (DUF1778 family)
MSARKFLTTRSRPVPIRIMTTVVEKKEMQRAAKKLDTPLSRFIREAALEKARGVEAGG